MPKKLEDFGLSEKEAKVYLAALELGHTTAEKLSKHAGVNRSTTYVQLDSLMDKGLISTHEEGKKTFFAPESPDLLRELIYKQKNAINAREEDLFKILPNLLAQFESAGERPLVRFFPGKHGISVAREEVLRMKGKDLCVLYSSENMTKLFPERQLDGYTNRRMAMGIHSRAIYTEEEYFKSGTQNKLTEGRYLPDMHITIDIRIFDNKTALFALAGSQFALVIESEQMAASMRIIFNFLWEKAERPEK